MRREVHSALRLSVTVATGVAILLGLLVPPAFVRVLSRSPRPLRVLFLGS